MRTHVNRQGGRTVACRRVAVALMFAGPGTALAQSLPPVPVPPENPMTEQKRVLGKMLFWEEQLSTDNTMACATCHIPTSGSADPRLGRNPGFDGIFFTEDDVIGSPGVIRSDENDDYVPSLIFGFDVQVTGRAAPRTINAAFAPDILWDGRATSTFTDPQTAAVSIVSGGALESQSVLAPMSDIEMSHAGRDWNQLTQKLAQAVPLALATDLPNDVASAIQASRSYPALFQRAFGDSTITSERIAYAIATYERTLIADQTPWDEFVAGNTSALTPLETFGWQAFQVLNCIACHTPPQFTDHEFRNVGVRPVHEDLGRQVFTGNFADRGKFKVPSLRNAGLKGSFSHTGRFSSLLEVMAFYNNDPAFPFFPENRDPLMQLVNLTPHISPAVEAFLENGLTDPRVALGLPPFDAPTLRSSRGTPNIQIVGPATPGSGGFEPTVIANVPPNVGNAGFKMGVHAALGGATANVYVSYVPPVGGRVSPDEVLGPFVLQGAGAGEGYSTLHWPIPRDPSLNGVVVYMQWVVSDPSGIGGEARSEAVAFEMFCSELGCISICYADCDPSTGIGVLDVFDFLCFQNSFVNGEPYACDCDTTTGPLVCDVFDFLCFQNAFVGGCP